jgi:hypothetical protein
MDFNIPVTIVVILSAFGGFWFLIYDMYKDPKLKLEILTWVE